MVKFLNSDKHILWQLLFIYHSLIIIPWSLTWSSLFIFNTIMIKPICVQWWLGYDNFTPFDKTLAHQEALCVNMSSQTSVSSLSPSWTWLTAGVFSVGVTTDCWWFQVYGWNIMSSCLLCNAFNPANVSPCYCVCSLVWSRFISLGIIFWYLSLYGHQSSRCVAPRPPIVPALHLPVQVQSTAFLSYLLAH